MIIHKIQETEAERQRQQEILQEFDNIAAAIREATSNGGSATQEQRARLVELTEEKDKISRALLDRYAKSRSSKQLLEDAKEIIEAIEKADFEEFADNQAEYQAGLRAEGMSGQEIAILIPFTIKDFENCCNYISLYVSTQREALEARGETAGADKVRAFIRKRAGLWYEEKRPANLPIVHGKATDALALMNTRNAEIDSIAHKATINKNGVKLELDLSQLNNPQAKLGVNTDKLLKTAISRFTAQNSFTEQAGLDMDPQQLNRGVTIPLKEYAQLLGYDVEEHPTSTPEEAAREKKRAKAQLDNARKAVHKDLDILRNITLTWTEEIKGKSTKFIDILLLSGKGIPHGQITIIFNEDMARYLAAAGFISYFPAALYRIRADQPNAYYIGLKLTEHYYIDTNQLRGTHDRLSITKVLEATDLPTYQEVMDTDRHWERRIKEPLEHSLDILKHAGHLESWEYTHAKGIPLTDEEAGNITSYAAFSKLYVHYKLKNPVDATERLQAKKKALATKKKNKAQKKKS